MKKILFFGILILSYVNLFAQEDEINTRKNLGAGGYDLCVNQIICTGRQTYPGNFQKKSNVSMDLFGNRYNVTKKENVRIWYTSDYYGRPIQNVSMYTDYYIKNSWVGRASAYKDPSGDYLLIKIEKRLINNPQNNY